MLGSDCHCPLHDMTIPIMIFNIIKIAIEMDRSSKAHTRNKEKGNEAIHN
uniref:Uncharacterized protein n=1 Tax=Rhizophora mucronata TaxID=61149 RepID=A0A2P2P7X6_RHIMU